MARTTEVIVTMVKSGLVLVLGRALEWANDRPKHPMLMRRKETNKPIQVLGRRQMMRAPISKNGRVPTTSRTITYQAYACRETPVCTSAGSADWASWPVVIL